MLNLDSELDKAFSPERVKDEYWQYKESKRDLFSSAEEPKFAMVMGADGVIYEAFEKQLDRHANNISRRVHEGKYLFYPFREVDIPKETPTPLPTPPSPNESSTTAESNETPSRAGYRTLSIASIRDAIVQRLVYDVLYETIEGLFLTLHDPFPVSFAYRKGKSAPKAAVRVHQHIQDGYRQILDADITKYFDTIPHDLLLERLSQVIDPASRTFDLVRRFIHTDRVPYESYRYAKRRGKTVGVRIFHWRKPERVRREQGIAQGGVLSGMLANLYLHDFDDWIMKSLGKHYDIRYVRYADDFVILARIPTVLNDIQTAAEEKLETLRLKLNQGKTRHIDVRDTPLEFVGFQFDGQHLRVRGKNIDRFKERVLEAFLARSEQTSEEDDTRERAIKHLKYLVRRVQYKIEGYSGSHTCPVCRYERVGPPRSWIAFFQVVTDKEQIRQLDKWIRDQICADVFSRYGVRLSRRELRQTGLRSLMNESYRVRQTRRKPCVCDLKQDGLEFYLKDLYEGRYFRTLVDKKPFRVDSVSSTSLQIRINQKTSELPLTNLLDAWKKLIRDGVVTRLALESSGFFMSSQIAALLSTLPGVELESTYPIRLRLLLNVQSMLREGPP
jgi:retron-type reverse transcriptase